MADPDDKKKAVPKEDKGNFSGCLKSIKTLPFSGKRKERFREWWRKLKAIASQDGWLIALESEKTIDRSSKDQNMLDYIKANDHGLNFLILSCSDDAWRYVEQAKTLHEAGKNLRTRYEYA
jgi:hypothetical protein